MYQQITIVGNLGADPELRTVPSGNSVCNFDVATSRKFTTRSGDERDDTTWFRIAVWGKQAEPCAKYLSKGRKVLVVGRVGVSAYTHRDGEARASLEINAATVQFLSDRDEGGYDNGHTQTQQAPKAEDYMNDEGDIPF